MPVNLSCSLGLYRADVFFAMSTKPVAKKPIPGKPQAVKPAQKNVVQKKSAPDKIKGLPVQIECDVVQPRDELGGRPKFFDVEVSADESLLRQFNGVSFV